MLIAPPPAQNFMETLRSRIVEGRSLSPYEYRPIVIPLFVTLGASRLQGGAQFTLPSNQRFRFRQMIPHVVMREPSAEDMVNGGLFTAAGGVFNGGDAADRIYAKMQNCRVTLKMASQTFDLFPQFSFPLSDLSSFNGFISSLFDMPGIIPQGTTIDLLASLSDPAAAGSDTEYGIALVGSYVAVE